MSVWNAVKVSRSLAESRCEWLNHCLGHWLLQCLNPPYRPLIGWVTLSDWNTQSGWHRKIYFTLAEMIPSENSIFWGVGGWATQPQTHSLESQSSWEENYQRMWQVWFLQTLSMLPSAYHFRPFIPHFSTLQLYHYLSCPALLRRPFSRLVYLSCILRGHEALNLIYLPLATLLPLPFISPSSPSSFPFSSALFLSSFLCRFLSNYSSCLCLHVKSALFFNIWQQHRYYCEDFPFCWTNKDLSRFLPQTVKSVTCLINVKHFL